MSTYHHHLLIVQDGREYIRARYSRTAVDPTDWQALWGYYAIQCRDAGLTLLAVVDDHSHAHPPVATAAGWQSNDDRAHMP